MREIIVGVNDERKAKKNVKWEEANIHIVQFVVEATSIADRLTILVSGIDPIKEMMMSKKMMMKIKTMTMVRTMMMKTFSTMQLLLSCNLRTMCLHDAQKTVNSHLNLGTVFL